MAKTKRCPFCAETIQAEAVVCRYCGRDLPQAPARRRRNFSGWLWLLFLLFACLIVVFAIRSIGPHSQPARQKTHDALGAWVVTEQFVKDRLKAPSTADFPCCYDDFTEYLGDGRYRVTAYVDSENAFGATLRTGFVAVVTWQGGDQWRLDSLAFDE